MILLSSAKNESPGAAGAAPGALIDGTRGAVRSSQAPARRRAPSSARLDNQRVDAVLVVHFPAGHRRVEHAHAADLGARAHAVLVVVVQQVEAAGCQLVHLAGGEVLDLTFTVGDEHGLDVVGVPEEVVGPCVQRGLVHGEPDTLTCEDDALAAPVLGLDVILGVGDVVEGANDHGRCPSLWRAVSDISQATASAVAWRRISRPWASSSFVSVSGGSSLITSSRGPEVSTSRPASNAFRQVAAAWSGFSNSSPRNKPRPLADKPLVGCSATMVFSADSVNAPLAMVDRSRSSSDQ